VSAPNRLTRAEVMTWRGLVDAAALVDQRSSATVDRTFRRRAEAAYRTPFPCPGDATGMRLFRKIVDAGRVWFALTAAERDARRLELAVAVAACREILGDAPEDPAPPAPATADTPEPWWRR
jgi:hypothetical protein